MMTRSQETVFTQETVFMRSTAFLRAASLLGLALAALWVWPSTALAQTPQNTGSAATAQADPGDDPDLDINLSQPDFTLIGLPTTLRVPKFKGAFRVTHRFGRPLGLGDFGDLAGDLFGLDSGANIGLEFRYGLASGLQAGIRRTNDKTIELFTQYSLLQQSKHGVGVGVIGSIDGPNNFKGKGAPGVSDYSPAVGLAISREFGEYGAVYVEPVWVNNTNPLPKDLVDDNDTIVVGLGARIRIRPTVYLVGEAVPRFGYAPGSTYGSFGIEKRAGGHAFQLNFSNGYGTTMGQLARGGTGSDDWYLGFNISRKFF
jgi:hypothetical protein